MAFGATPVRAALHLRKISETIDGTSVSDVMGGIHFPAGPILFGTTVPFSLRFVLDDTVPSTSAGSGVDVEDGETGLLRVEFPGLEAIAFDATRSPV